MVLPPWTARWSPGDPRRPSRGPRDAWGSRSRPGTWRGTWEVPILGLRSRSILDGYFNPLVLWYQWEYLRSPAKNLIFCRVSKIGNEMASLWVEQHNNTCLLVTVRVPSIPWLNIFAEFVAYRLSDSHTLPQLHSVLCLGWLKILKVNPLISPQWSQLRGNSFIKPLFLDVSRGCFILGRITLW